MLQKYNDDEGGISTMKNHSHSAPDTASRHKIYTLYICTLTRDGLTAHVTRKGHEMKTLHTKKAL